MTDGLGYDWHTVVQRESDAFLVAARSGLEEEVPGCPGWHVRELVAHLGQVHRFHGSHVARGVDAPPEGPRPIPPDSDEALLAWFDEGYRELLAVLSRADPDTPAWNWSPHAPRTAAFWRRRMAQETAVHRWDAESAHHNATGFDLAVAADGIDEMLTVMRPAELTEAPAARTGTALLRATDTDRQWAVRLDPDELTLLAGPPPAPDATLQGTATALLLALWGRVPLAELDATGDLALLAALREDDDA